MTLNSIIHCHILSESFDISCVWWYIFGTPATLISATLALLLCYLISFLTSLSGCCLYSQPNDHQHHCGNLHHWHCGCNWALAKTSKTNCHFFLLKVWTQSQDYFPRRLLVHRFSICAVSPLRIDPILQPWKVLLIVQTLAKMIFKLPRWCQATELVLFSLAGDSARILFSYDRSRTFSSVFQPDIGIRLL